MALAGAIAASGCAQPDAHTALPKTTVRLAWPTAGPFSTELAKAYGGSSDVTVRIVQESDPLHAIAEGRADATVTLADMAYFAYRDAPRLRAIAALEVIPIQLVVRKDTAVHGLSDLRGHTVAGPFTRAATLVFDAAGLSGKIQTRPLTERQAPLSSADGPDALVITSYYPNAAVESALRNGGRLVPIEGVAVDRAQSSYPFIRRTVIPPHTYPGQTEAVPTIATNMLYICRQDLDEQLVHALADGLFRALPQMSERIQPLRLVNVEAASAVPIPLHAGAARYYREREIQ
jgi:TRAP transporter TAXI family solute receptor